MQRSSSEYNSKEKNDKVNNDQAYCNFKHARTPGTCF